MNNLPKKKLYFQFINYDLANWIVDNIKAVTDFIVKHLIQQSLNINDFEESKKRYALQNRYGSNTIFLDSYHNEETSWRQLLNNPNK